MAVGENSRYLAKKHPILAYSKDYGIPGTSLVSKATLVESCSKNMIQLRIISQLVFPKIPQKGLGKKKKKTWKHHPVTSCGRGTTSSTSKTLDAPISTRALNGHSAWPRQVRRTAAKGAPD